MSIADIYANPQNDVYNVKTHASGPKGSLPLTGDMLRELPCGDIFGMTLDAGMGWKPEDILGPNVLIISTLGGKRNDDGTPDALGLHVGHWELGLQISAASKEIKQQKGVPFASYVTDPCDGRTQGTTGMYDSLPFRNDAAMVFRRQIRSLPTVGAVIGVASCDKGLPATMMALASMHDLPCVMGLGGSTLPPTDGEDLGKVQTIGARYSNNELSLEDAARLGCRACGSAGGGCQFLGTAGTSQVVAEGLGLALPHTALAPSGEPVWVEVGRQSAKAVMGLLKKGITIKDIITDKAIENAMMVHAAFGGSTNLLLHLPAIAHAGGCHRPTVEDWARVNSMAPRLVSVLPNGPVYHPTVRAFMAGGVPEVMLHLRDLGLLHLDALTVTGHTVGENLEWWEKSERRAHFRRMLKELDNVEPDDVIMSPARAKERGLTSTITFPVGNIAPEGSVIKSTAIDPTVIDADGVYRHTAAIKVFTAEPDAIKAIKAGKIEKGDMLVVIGGGPCGTGMEETYQLTSALKHLSYGKYVCLLTDARFSGVSTGACVGHIGPEALVGGPVSKLRDGDIVELGVDCNKLEGRVNFIGTDPQHPLTPEEGAKVLAGRETHPGLKPAPALPDDTRLWAALQAVSGGTWGGSVYDVDKIVTVLEAGKKALGM